MNKTKFFCLLMGALLAATPLPSQNVNIMHPSQDIEAQHHSSPEEIRDRLNGPQLQKDAKELAELCASIPADMDGVRRGLLDKDVVQKLKRVEKLSKHVRETYNNRQIELQNIQNKQNEIQAQRNTDLREMEVVEKMIPHLAEEKGKAVALVTIRILARPELATQIAETVGGPGSAEALVKWANTATTGEERAANVAALANVASSSKQAQSIAEPVLKDARNEAVQIALELVKKRPSFVWGGKTPSKGFDSSGFVAYVLNQAGLLENYTQFNSTRLQQRFGVDQSTTIELVPGDLIFYSEGACMLYIGNDEMVGILPDGVIRKRTSEDIGFQRLGVGHVTSYRG